MRLKNNDLDAQIKKLEEEGNETDKGLENSPTVNITPPKIVTYGFKKKGNPSGTRILLNDNKDFGE